MSIKSSKNRRNCFRGQYDRITGNFNWYGSDHAKEEHHFWASRCYFLIKTIPGDNQYIELEICGNIFVGISNYAELAYVGDKWFFGGGGVGGTQYLLTFNFQPDKYNGGVHWECFYFLQQIIWTCFIPGEVSSNFMLGISGNPVLLMDWSCSLLC